LGDETETISQAKQKRKEKKSSGPFESQNNIVATKDRGEGFPL